MLFLTNYILYIIYNYIIIFKTNKFIRINKYFMIIITLACFPFFKYTLCTFYKYFEFLFLFNYSSKYCLIFRIYTQKIFHEY